MKRQNLFYVDLLKAFAIFLVTVGHSLDGLGFRASGWRGFIYSFHMPLFFSISGFLVAYAFVQKAACGGANVDFRWSIWFVLKKFQALIIPYLFWLFVVGLWFFKGNVPSMETYIQYCKMYIFDNKGYWFLPCLFFLMIAFCCNVLMIGKLRKYSIVKDMGSVAVIGCVYVILYKTTRFDFFRGPLSYIVPFFVGVYIGRFAKAREFIAKSDLTFTICLVVFCLASGFFIGASDQDGKIFRLIAGVASIPLAFRLAMTCETNANCKRMNKLISHVSRNTLIIYVMQPALIYTRYMKSETLASVIPPTGQLVLAVSLSVVVIAICLCAAFVISQSRSLSYLMLGKNFKK